MRQVWSGFQTWIAERHNERRSSVDDMLSSLQRLHNSVCKAEFQQNLWESSFSKVAELFERYMFFLRTNKVSCWRFGCPVDWVDILLALIRALTEGEWGLHISSIWKLIPLVLCLWLCQLCEIWRGLLPGCNNYGVEAPRAACRYLPQLAIVGVLRRVNW